MDVISTGPLRVASLAWQPRPGSFALAFACKATFALAPGTSPLASVQDALFERDEHWNDDERGSLARACELVPFKRRADVLVTGHAHAPGGQAVGSLLARLVAGEVDKTLAVHGDRLLGAGDQVSEATRFVRMPLRWERAAGGPGTANPVGMALDGPVGPGGQVRVPNLLTPGVQFVTRRETLAPVGFMPVAPSWPGRLDKLRHHAATWNHRRWSDRPLPDDIDAGYFNAAPPDQQVNEIRADERLVLENLHATYSRLVTNLQPLSPRAYAEVSGAPPEEVRLRCDTLTIDTDRGTATLVWRGNLRVAHPGQPGRIVVTLDAPPATAVATGSRPAPAKLQATAAIDMAKVREAASLPFSTPETAPSALASSAPRVALPALAAVHAKFGGTTGIDPAIVRQAALPFGATRSPSSPSSPPPPLDPPAPPPARPEAPAPSEPPPAPPPMIGPLAKIEARPVEEAPERAPDPPPAPPEAPAPTPEEEPPLPLDRYPLERCAAIAASIARRKAEKLAVLERHELWVELWAELDAHWTEAVQNELSRGKTALLSAYDTAFVAQLEAERGEVTVEEYAALVVSAERGTEKETLAKLDLPRGAVLRVQRVWLKRIAKSPALGKLVRAAVDGAAEG